MKRQDAFGTMFVLITFWGLGVWASPTVEPLTMFEGHGPEVDLKDQRSPEDGALWSTGSAMPPAVSVPSPTLYEHSKLREDLEHMASFAPSRQRVKIRAVADRGLPVLYPAYHWLPDAMLEVSMKRVWEAGGRDLRLLWAQSGANFLGEDHTKFDVVTMLGLLNVRVYHDAEDPSQRGATRCCAPSADLVVELAVDESDVRVVRMAMNQTDAGVYYVADPIQAAGEVLSEVISLGERPLLAIVGLHGVGYEPVPRAQPISYAVRWGDLELEYGTHYAGDPGGVVR